MADDLATLAIKVTYSDALGASNALDSLSVAGARADGAVGGLSRTSQSSIASMNLLRTAAIGLFGAFSVKTLFDMTDAWSDMTSRVNLAAGSVERGSAVMSRLQEIARNTYSSLSQTAEGYLANASSMRELGYTTQQVLDYTSALNNAMVVSGAKAERATMVQSALAKAMALGKLSGENLNTVIQHGGEVATLLAERFGTTTGGLMKLGQQGKLTGSILVDTLIKAMSDLEEKAGSMPATISDGLGLIGNSLLRAVGAFDQANKISESFAEKLVFIADNMERFIATGLAAVGVWGTQYVAAMARSVIATLSLEKALMGLRTAIARTGLGVLVIIIGDVIYRMYEAIRVTDTWGGAFSKFGESMSFVWDAIREMTSASIRYMQGAWAGFLSFLAKSTSELLGLLGVTFDVSDAIEKLDDDARRFRIGAAGGLENALASLSKSYEVLQGIKSSTKLDDDGGIPPILSGISKEAERLQKAWESLMGSIDSRISQLRIEAQMLGRTGVEADALRVKLEALAEADRLGLSLTEKQIIALEGKADAIAKLTRQISEYQLMADAAFEREQMFRSPIDQRIMQDLKMAGIEIDSIAGQTYASFVKTTDQIGLAKDATRDFAGSLVSDLIQGKSALDSLISALGKLGDKLIQLALDEAINGLFGGLFGAVSGGGGFGLGYFPPAPSMGMGIPGFASGTANTGGMPGQPIGIVHGQEAVIPLPSGGDIPVRVTGDSQSQSAYTDNRAYNFTGTSEEFQQFKAYVAEQERNFDARAVGAIREAEQSNYKFGT